MLRTLLAVVLFGLLGCDGGGTPAPDRATVANGEPGVEAPTPAAAPARAARPTGIVHEVRMELVSGQHRFDPASLTIRAGDAVRWVNISGGPHNVHFKRDRIPAGAADVLNAAMPGRLNDLQGPFRKDSLDFYQVVFTGAPSGSYAYTCTPHELMGMSGSLTVR